MFEFLTPTDHRAHRQERLDDPLVPPRAMIESLRAVGRINRATGGLRTSMAGIDTLFESRPVDEPLRLLDVGTGDGSFLDAADRWASRRGVALRAVGIELRRPVVAHFSEAFRDRPHIDIRREDLFDMATTERYDIVHASLVLHHFDDDSMVTALRRMSQLATCGVIINDLHRHALAYTASHLLIRSLTRDRMAHHDGPLSVERGFTRRELTDACRRANLTDACVAWRWPFRWLVTSPVAA